MHIRDMLLARQAELESSISAVRSELGQISRALKAIDEKPVQIGEQPLLPKQVPASSVSAIRHSMPVNDAIVIAVEAGCKTPTTILAHLVDKLAVMTTLNSVRSRVSPLGRQGKIRHDDSGWVPARKGDLPSGESGEDTLDGLL